MTDLGDNELNAPLPAVGDGVTRQTHEDKPLPQVLDLKAQAQRYRGEVLPPTVPARLAVELGAVHGWHRYVGDQGAVMGIERFGSSAPVGVLMREFGFTTDNVLAHARHLMSVLKKRGASRR